MAIPWAGSPSRFDAFDAFDGAAAHRHCRPMSNPDFEAARLTVRLDAIVANYRLCQRLAGPAVVSGVVKADAYGMGAVPVTRALAAAGCDTFFVARLEEGVALRKIVREARIFVLDGAAPDAVPALIENALTPVLNSLAEIAGWSAAARETKTTLEAAVHIDTGMNRLGLPGEELSLLASGWRKRLEGLRIVLWVSHLACADDPEAKMNRIVADDAHRLFLAAGGGPDAFFTGMVLALQSLHRRQPLRRRRPSCRRSWCCHHPRAGPVIAGLMVAGRVGAAIAAEIGTMRVTEQIDALTTLSTNPIKYLVVPR
jgi:hypothetical protein